MWRSPRRQPQHISSVIWSLAALERGIMKELMNRLNLMDCMEGMGHFPDKYFELAIVDPPYGLGDRLIDGGHKKNPMEKYRKSYEEKRWDNAPSEEYFIELSRISKNQIIWGGNYFADNLIASSCWIIWDKVNGNNLYADCELAWTSFNSAARQFTYQWHGMLQQDMKNKETRIHPTQKPVALYTWLLQNYAKRGDKIIDTHVGSASSLIACHRMGFEYWGFELDADYFKAATERLEREKAMQPLFSPQEIYEQVGLDL